MPRTRLLILLLCVTIFTSGCTNKIGLPVTDSQPSVTLPPAEVKYVAPIGDAALEYIAPAVLYLPSHDGISLTPVEVDVTFSLVRPAAESIARALLAHGGTKEASSLGGSVRLSLYGANPVEISRDVATVNLSASALKLDREQLYIVSQAIANTLTELDEINYVNILVVDKPVGLDIANSLPMGALKYASFKDLGAVYDQLLSRKVNANQPDTTPPLSADIALYFPLQSSDGLVCEARSLSFENQQPATMITTILRELAAGPVDSSISSTTLPLLADLLTHEPSVHENPKTGGQMISLDFAPNLDDMLEAYDVSRRQCAASICYTLASFFPNVAGIELSVNGIPALQFAGENSTEASDGIYLRADFSDLIYDYCTLYFADSKANKLQPVKRAIAYYQCSNPRVLLCELAEGPKPGDSITNLEPVMKENGITDTTILGFAISNGILLTNFAPSFSNLGNEINSEEERLLAYAIVNTLCAGKQTKSVCFFQSGVQFDGFSGEIYWGGLFYPIPD